MLDEGYSCSRNHWLSSRCRKFIRCLRSSKKNTRGIHMTLELIICLFALVLFSPSWGTLPPRKTPALALHSEQDPTTHILFTVFIVEQQHNRNRHSVRSFSINNHEWAIGTWSACDHRAICDMSIRFSHLPFWHKKPAGLERLPSHSAVRNYFVRAYRNILGQLRTKIFWSRAWSCPSC